MIDVVLDTNIYRNDPWRKGSDFVALSRLLRSKSVRLHVPYFVKYEQITYLDREYFSRHLDAISRAIKQFKRNLDQDTATIVVEFEEKFGTIRKHLENYSETEFTNWLEENNAVVHEISENHGAKVAKDYFEGNPPFRGVKEREDFPDAFIWQVISDLLGNVQELHIVVGDKRLRKACNSLDNAITYTSLKEFLTTDFCQSLLIEAGIEENIRNLLKYLPKRKEFIFDAIKAQIDDKLYGEEIESPWIPDDNNLAIFSGIEKIESIDIEIDSAQYYGGGLIVIPFQMYLHSILNYAIFIPDYYLLDEKRSEHISTSILNKHYYEAEEIYPVEIEGNIAMIIDILRLKERKMPETEFDIILDDAIVKIDSFDSFQIPDDVWRNWD